MQNKEFSDGSGLECEDYGARMYDGQLGRFLRCDPLSNESEHNSPYIYVSDNPVLFNDPTGESEQNSNAIASSFVDPNGKLIQHREDGDPRVFLVRDVTSWLKGGQKKEDAHQVGYEYPGVDYFSMVGKTAVYYKSNSPNYPAFLNDGPIEEDHIIEGALFVGFRIIKSIYSTGDFLWGFWNDYQHIMYKGRQYAKIGKRLFTQHAVDRTAPSSFGKAAGGSSGRSISPEYIEQVIQEGTQSTNVANGVSRTLYTSGNVTVVTEEEGKIIVTVITK